MKKDETITRVMFCEGAVQFRKRVVTSLHYTKDKVEITSEGPWVQIKDEKERIKVPMTHIKQIDFLVE